MTGRYGLVLFCGVALFDGFSFSQASFPFQEAGGGLNRESCCLDSFYAGRVWWQWFCQRAVCFGAEHGPEVCRAEEIHLEAIFSVSVTVDRLLVFAFWFCG